MQNLIPFLTYVCVTTFTPGPNNIMSMTFGMRDGYKKTLGFLAGIFTGFLLLMEICGLLNFVLLNLLPQVKLWLNILGAAYMVYLAIYILRSKPDDENHNGNSLNTFNAGFILQFVNLKGILYGVTVYSTFIIQSYHTPLQISLFAPLLATIAFIATSCWAIGGDVFRRYLNKHYRIFNLVMAVLLIYTAIASLLEAFWSG
jgi:cysteine/O-acetylserine efflux protein